MTRRHLRAVPDVPEHLADDPEPAAAEVARTIVLRQLTASTKSRKQLEEKLAERDVPEDVAAAVKAQVDAGADVIKVYGSTGSGSDVTGRQTLSFEEMKAIVDAARASGRRVAIHSYGPAGGRDAGRLHPVGSRGESCTGGGAVRPGKRAAQRSRSGKGTERSPLCNRERCYV